MPIDLGPRLKALIARKGFRSVSAAARHAGISRTQLWDIIRGDKSPNIKTLEAIVTAIGGTLGELFADED
jgi:DNA-binding phage protein